MPLLRTGVVLALGIAMLPSDKATQEAVYARAANWVQWTVTFCERNEDTCRKSGEAWDAFLLKAEFAGQLAYDAARRYSASQSEVESTGELSPLSHVSARARGTLNEQDLRPAWRGNSSRHGT